MTTYVYDDGSVSPYDTDDPYDTWVSKEAQQLLKQIAANPPAFYQHLEDSMPVNMIDSFQADPMSPEVMLQTLSLRLSQDWDFSSQQLAQQLAQLQSDPWLDPGNWNAGDDWLAQAAQTKIAAAEDALAQGASPEEVQSIVADLANTLRQTRTASGAPPAPTAPPPATKSGSKWWVWMLLVVGAVGAGAAVIALKKSERRR